jgi:hypothetical protein
MPMRPVRKAGRRRTAILFAEGMADVLTIQSFYISVRQYLSPDIPQAQTCRCPGPQGKWGADQGTTSVRLPSRCPVCRYTGKSHTQRQKAAGCFRKGHCSCHSDSRDWTNSLLRPKPADVQVPKASGERIKVLHLSDFHLDARYAVSCFRKGHCSCHSDSRDWTNSLLRN